MSLQFIQEMKASIAIYTYGSITGGITAGGAATVTREGDPADPVITLPRPECQKGGPYLLLL